jgi:hypothetical protein
VHPLAEHAVPEKKPAVNDIVFTEIFYNVINDA